MNDLTVYSLAFDECKPIHFNEKRNLLMFRCGLIIPVRFAKEDVSEFIPHMMEIHKEHHTEGHDFSQEWSMLNDYGESGIGLYFHCLCDISW